MKFRWTPQSPAKLFWVFQDKFHHQQGIQWGTEKLRIEFPKHMIANKGVKMSLLSLQKREG